MSEGREVNHDLRLVQVSPWEEHGRGLLSVGPSLWELPQGWVLVFEMGLQFHWCVSVQRGPQRPESRYSRRGRNLCQGNEQGRLLTHVVGLQE